ncbi:unnamed protein product [Candidula unifasciata]|uniref:Kinesin motor domain-containing protein n=1 Tax=Candidula unifasciata TaxID=100452 RepID=A0A8S3Z0F1_9EUPU|nr:unnamed protein product [Candidula unifasciata]
MALLNGQRHVPHRDSKIAQLLRDSLGNLSCRTCMIAHVSSAVAHYNETLQVIQLAARIHRMKRRRTKFSSTSSEDSSTDGDVKFRRPYRGLRMGTLREDILYSSPHSDPDYTSSSEQSCDTVIYIGANGQSLSDRELTDNEGPPRHVPRTNPRLPRRPSGSRSSGDDSDSGRSMHSVRSLESRLPIRALMSPPPMAAVAAVKMTQPQGMQSMPGSPNPGLVKMGHRMGLGSKMSGVPDGRIAAGDGVSASGHWQERPTKIHCHSSQSKLAKAIHEKQQPLEGEQWIDGPGAAIYPDPKNSEMWVDGPPAFVVQQQPHTVLSSSDEHHQQHYRTDSSSKRLATKKVDAEEQWVDGPKEMLTGSSLSQPMHTCSKAEYTSKSSHQSLGMSSGVNEKTLKQALVKHILETKDSPESSMSIDSNSSLHVEAADSSSISLNSSDDQSKSSHPNKINIAGPHSASSDSKQVDASSSPMVSARGSKLSDSPKKIHSSTQSPLPSPGPSPSVSRKHSKLEASHMAKLQKSQLPGSASPTHRVVQWIKSVSSKQESTGSVSNISRLDHSGHCPAQVTAPSENVTMADAETNTEHDSDFERLAEETGFKSESEEDMGTHKASKNLRCEAYDSDDIKCSIAIDTSLDSSFDNSVTIQESIYEHEVEEQLELLKTKDGTRLASEVDNETFSNMSCSYKDSDEQDRDSNNPEADSLLVQHTKILTESKQAAQIAHHIATNCQQTSISSSGSNVYETSRPMLSRKPDGASNPNLLKVFLEEDLFNKTQLNCPQGTSLEAMFITAGHESSMEYPSTSLKSCVDEDIVCDNDVSVQSICGKGDSSNSGYLSSPKLGAKNKPPLPTKLSPVFRQSGLPKSATNSQTSVNYSPSRSIYCTAKPTHSVKDSPGVQQKTSPSGKLSGIPLSNVTCRNKLVRSDKTASSSLTSHSPQSSAASSPHISSTSKSSSSSPALKAGPKTLNGSTNKSFCSKSLSTLTKDNGKLRKKEKEKDIKGGSTNRTTKLSELVNKGKGNDSDSGNDSGIVALERRLLSPYATVTKPRTPSHSSSGHGSDNSTVSTEVHSGISRPCTKAENLHGGTSSGYESMLRDSEATGSSSGQEDSGSEVSECPAGAKRKGTRRSHSAPSRSTESSPVSSQPSQAGTRSATSAHRAWVDTRHLHKVKDEPLELKRYDPDEVERLGRRRTDDEVKIPLDIRTKNGSTKSKEEGDEISDSKDRIMMERNGWSFDCKFLMCFSCKSGQRGTDV